MRDSSNHYRSWLDRAVRAQLSHLSPQERQALQEVILKATPLWERVDGLQPADHEADDALLVRRIGEWRAVMGGADALTRRLAPRALDGLLPLLRESGSPDLGPRIPDWSLTLSSVIGEAQRSFVIPGSRATSFQSQQTGGPLPFQEIFEPFVAIARQGLEHTAGPALSALAPLAVQGLERQLVAHLSFVAHLVLAEDFSLFRFSRAPAAAFEELWNQTDSSTEIYRAYVAQSQDFLRLASARPVLARLLSQSVNQWVIATANLCRRFASDFALLKRTFHWDCGSIAGAIELVCTDLSDRHKGGQTVLELLLRSGYKVIYKPHTVGPERAFYEFLSQLALEDLSLSLRTLRVVDCGDYGWCEVAVPSACNSLEAVASFYRRAGMLLAACHLLAITDIHCDNIIAAGEHPVIVDLETLLSAWVPPGSDGWSLLNTGLLPRWQTAPGGHRFDLSGLGADGVQDSGIGRRAWIRVNTDQMHLSEPLSVRASTTHRPAIGPVTASLRDHSEELISGFKEMYALLMRRRDNLLSRAQALTMFDGLKLRTLLRGTATYTRLQLRLLHPEFMATGVDRSIALEWLARPLSGPALHKDDRHKIYDHEREAMENLDVPTFDTSFTSQVTAGADDQDLALLCLSRNASLVRERLAQLSVADCGRQIEAIEQAVRDRYA